MGTAFQNLLSYISEHAHQRSSQSRSVIKQVFFLAARSGPPRHESWLALDYIARAPRSRRLSRGLPWSAAINLVPQRPPGRWSSTLYLTSAVDDATKVSRKHGHHSQHQRMETASGNWIKLFRSTFTVFMLVPYLLLNDYLTKKTGPNENWIILLYFISPKS